MPFVQISGSSESVRVNTVFCIGRNYAEHAKELNNPIPKKPMVFLKPNSSLELPNGKVELPAESNDVHHEVELVLLIGKKGSKLSVDEAWSYVSAIGIGIDFTARDLQQKAKEKGHPWTLSKGFDTFGPVSEFISSNEFNASTIFELELQINNETRQHGFTSDMIFSISELVSYVSGFSTLQEGDLIFTGTPEGVSKVNSGDKLRAILNKGVVNLELSIA